MITTAVILAAGRGTRLKEITSKRSKAMAPVVGLPMIARVMDSLRASGMKRFVVVTAPGDHELHRYCSAVPEACIRVQDQPKGSGNALRVCEADLTEAFVVSACDSLLDPADICAVVKLFLAEKAQAALSVMQVDENVSLQARSVVRCCGVKVEEFIEKPGASERISDTTSLPLWVLSPTVFSELRELKPSPRGEYELPAVFNAMIAKGQRVVAHEAKHRSDLTTIDDLVELNCMFLREMSPLIQVHQSTYIPAGVRVIPPVKIDEGCQIGDGAQIGPEVYIEQGARVAPGVELRQVVVTSGAQVTESGSQRVYV